MLKVLLADTDEINIKNFSRFIKTSLPEIKVVGSADTNSNLIALIKELRPRLIISDLKFLGTNFVKTIKDINGLFPDIRFIIFGNYNDSEYFERISEYGVIDYIYRPVKPAELERCLRQAIKIFDDMAKINQTKNKLINDYQNNIALFQDKFLSNLINGYLTNDFEINNNLKYFDINLTPSYTAFIVRIDSFKKIILTLDEQEKHLLVYQILIIVKEKIARGNNGIAFINRLNSITVVLGGSVELNDIITLCDAIKTEVLHQTKYCVTIGVGRMYEKASDISVSAKEAEAALRYRHILGHNTIIPIHFVEPGNHITYRFPHEKEERLVFAAVTGEYDYCEQLLSQIVTSLNEYTDMPEQLLTKIFMNITISINRFLTEQNLHGESNFTTYFPSREIFEMRTPDEMHAFFSKALKSFCGHMLELRNENNMRIINKVKEYINEKYQENVSLPKLAVYTETTPEFLSNIFINSEKQSIYQYAISVRLEKAKELLRETQLRDDVIAVNVGYDDVKYFRGVFKQYVGISTNEYRLRTPHDTIST